MFSLPHKSHNVFAAMVTALLLPFANLSAQGFSGQNFPLSPPASRSPDQSAKATVFVGLGLTSYTSNPQLPVPENGSLVGDTYRNGYFDLSYSLPKSWIESVKGPPPSATGYYVLSQLKASGNKGTMSISASDLFFLLQPADNAIEFLQHTRTSLPAVLTVEKEPSEFAIGQRRFARLDYTGAEIHWSIVATEMRCHIVQFVFVSRDPQLLDILVHSLDARSLPPDTGMDDQRFPVCVKSYASDANVLHKADPASVGPKFSSVPVRIIIDKQGRVEQIHVISGFPEQAKSISDALSQWTFKPYVRDGQAREVETGLLFEFKPDGVHARAEVAQTVPMPVKNME